MDKINEDFIDLSDDYIDFEFSIDEGFTPPNDKILNRIQGQFFVPDGYSRNERFYPKSLWNKVLMSEDTKKSLNDGMLGTLLHPTNEKLAHPIYSSHVVKNLWINENNKGMGQAYILNTPVGRVVHTLGESGLVKLYVSSRAYGKLKNEKYKGYPVVDEDNYIFRTFDVVLDPGFLEASPQFESSQYNSMLEDLADCYLENIDEVKKKFNFTTRQKNKKAKSLIRDLNTILKR